MPTREETHDLVCFYEAKVLQLGQDVAKLTDENTLLRLAIAYIWNHNGPFRRDYLPGGILEGWLAQAKEWRAASQGLADSLLTLLDVLRDYRKDGSTGMDISLGKLEQMREQVEEYNYKVRCKIY